MKNLSVDATVRDPDVCILKSPETIKILQTIYIDSLYGIMLLICQNETSNFTSSNPEKIFIIFWSFVFFIPFFQDFEASIFSHTKLKRQVQGEIPNQRSINSLHFLMHRSEDQNFR